MDHGPCKMHGLTLHGLEGGRSPSAAAPQCLLEVQSQVLKGPAGQGDGALP